MSLRVWLPLTKDTQNQGLMELPTPWAVWSKNEGGKIGQYCYSDCAIYHKEEEWLDNKWSLSCWVKSSNWGTYNDILMCKNTSEFTQSQFYFSIIGGTRLNLGTNGGSKGVSYNYTFSTNTWYHVTATYDGTIACLYINGEKVKTQSYPTVKLNGMNNFCIGCRSSNAAGTSATGNASKKFNDVRVYDHALSPLEVKHIAQGLILHYPLNRGGWGQENLIANSNVEKSGKGGLILYDLTTTGINTVLGKTMRISADIKSDMINSILDCYVRSSSSRSMCSNTIFTNIGTDYKRYSMTTICNTNQSLTPQWFAFCSNGSNGTTSTATFTIKNVKLEIGENTTPWSPASSDVLATTMGLNDNVEYDTSGYGNNGTKVGTFSYDSDTSKYNVSTVFNGTNSYITINPLIIDMNAVSFAIWIKWDNFNSYSRIWDFGQVASGGGYCCFLMNDATNGSIKLRLRNASGNELLNYNFITANINTWYHIAFTLSNTICKVYVNGVLKDTKTLSSNIGTAIFNYPYIGKSNWSTDALLDGKLSDFRIYATALSAEDVKSLYNNSAYIDNQGNIYGAVYEEV